MTKNFMQQKLTRAFFLGTIITLTLFKSDPLFAQNSLVGDGFGGRSWYEPHNFQAGEASAYAVCDSTNQLYGWGDNQYSQLGNGTTMGSDIPIIVSGMTNIKYHTSGILSGAIKYDSTAWLWGNTGLTITNIPSQVLTKVKFMDIGISHAVFIKYDGTVWGIGNNSGGQLGNNATSNMRLTVPVKMIGVNNAIRAVAAGGDGYGVSVILLEDGTLKITGNDARFAIDDSSLQTLNGLYNIIDIKSGTQAVYALNNNGDVYALGLDGGSYGILGFPNCFCTYALGKITFPSGSAPIVAISANNSGSHALALDENGNVYGWGHNTYGELGDSTYTNILAPKLVAQNAVDILAGGYFSYVIKSDNTLWATGRSIYPAPNKGSIWMNLPNIQRNVFTQIDPTIAPMNLCAPKVYGVMPVKLEGFAGMQQGSANLLTWHTASEQNNRGFELQRSANGTAFAPIAFIPSQARGGSTTNALSYRYADLQPLSGDNFYRLHQTDIDGHATVSGVVLIRGARAGQLQVTAIYPNPAMQHINVTLQAPAAQAVQVLITDIAGQALQQQSIQLQAGENNKMINIATLHSGTYIIKLLCPNGCEAAVQKFVKQ